GATFEIEHAGPAALHVTARTLLVERVELEELGRIGRLRERAHARLRRRKIFFEGHAQALRRPSRETPAHAIIDASRRSRSAVTRSAPSGTRSMMTLANCLADS